MTDLLQTQQVMFLRKEILIFQYSKSNGCDVELQFSLLFIFGHLIRGDWLCFTLLNISIRAVLFSVLAS